MDPSTPHFAPLFLPYITNAAVTCGREDRLAAQRSKRRLRGRSGWWVEVAGGRRWRDGRAQSRSVRSGAAPPVIIRVTAARARLRAACTRRDVLPRERSEHLSVPPRRQQPPTSLSNSTQLVTRSPNSYFLSLARSHSRTYAHARAQARSPTLSTLFFFLLHTPLLAGSGSSGQVVNAAGLRCRLPIARNERV